jgi:S1-C subfamily serine protease
MGEMLVTESNNALLSFSSETAALVERAAASVVTVHGGGRYPSSGLHWRPGVIVTAEERLERDDTIKLTLPGGRQTDATLAGRDPTTDVAVLRFQGEGLPVAVTTNAAPRSGEVALSVGAYEGSPLAALGIVALAGGAWRSARGGTIDTLIRLDLTLNLAGEGGALVDMHGQVIGMTVLGPRQRALAIPASTINRSVDQLLARGHVFRGYLGAGLQSIRQSDASNGSQPLEGGRGILIVSLDPAGPCARAGLLVGDIVTAWNGAPVGRVSEVMRLLGPESVGSTVDLGLIRGGAPTAHKVIIGERSIA